MFKKLIILIVLSFVLISCDSKKEISQNPIMTKKEYNYIIEKVDKYLDKGEYKEAIKLLLKAAEYNKSDYKKIAWIYSQISGEEGENVLLHRTLGNIKTDEYQFAMHIEYAKNPVLTMKKLENMESG